ncbi:MAG: hypothetical protein ABI690_24015 [Chloroflexota bacterium]
MSRKILLLFAVILVIIFVSLGTWKQANSWEFPPSTTTPDPVTTYDPSTYNLPNTIAGYRILTVQTSKNTACMTPDVLRLTVQPINAMVGNPLASEENTNLRAELEKLKLDVEWELQYVTEGPYDLEKFVSGNATWNETMTTVGCQQSGPAIIITSTPDPFASYAPATYGIPDSIAGYEVLAVKTLENTACMMPDTMLLLLQSDKENVDAFLESANPQTILEALKNLGLKVAIELEYMGPDTWDKEQFISNTDEWNRTMKSGGCLLGGPAVAITPPSQ